MNALLVTDSLETATNYGASLSCDFMCAHIVWGLNLWQLNQGGLHAAEGATEAQRQTTGLPLMKAHPVSDHVYVCAYPHAHMLQCVCACASEECMLLGSIPSLNCNHQTTLIKRHAKESRIARLCQNFACCVLNAQTGVKYLPTLVELRVSLGNRDPTQTSSRRSPNEP